MSALIGKASVPSRGAGSRTAILTRSSASHKAHAAAAVGFGRQAPSPLTPGGVIATQRVSAWVSGNSSSRNAFKRADKDTPLLRRHIVAEAAVADAGTSPSDESSSAGTSTFLQAVLNVMNILMGVGLLSIPYALKEAGWVGLGVLVVLGLVTNYSGKALVEAHGLVKAKTGKAMVGYEDIAEEAFGTAGRALVSVIMYVELFGTCALLFILQGDNLTNLFGTSMFESKKKAMIAAACVMIPTMWLPDVTALSYLGFLGVIATITVVSSVIYTFVTGSFVAGAATTLVNPSTLPLTFGIMAFVYAGHGVFPSIQASMKEPQQFTKVLNTAYLVVGSFCGLIGALGYYMYGNGVADIIIFSLPAGPLALLCSCLVMINPVTKYALTLEPVAAAVAKSGAGGFLPGAFRRFSIRNLLAVGTLVSAMYVPYLAMVMALIGSVLTISISVVLPAAFHLILSGKNNKTKAWDYSCMVAGAICAVSGTFAALKGLAAEVAKASIAA